MTAEKKFVYFFGAGASEGTAQMRDLLGGKGANLADMASLGLPVPPVSLSPLKRVLNMVLSAKPRSLKKFLRRSTLR